MNAHDEMLDNVAVYALGALNGDEARVVALHLRTCAGCQAEYNALRSHLLKARIMQQVRAVRH
ncbi:MAG: zf-HC2 domain-containing protein [Candidatus Aquilonibacter sp.]